MTLETRELNIPLNKRRWSWLWFVASFALAVLIIRPSLPAQWLVTVGIVAPTVWLCLVHRSQIGRRTTNGAAFSSSVYRSRYVAFPIMLGARIFVLACMWAGSAYATQLIHLAVKGQPVENGKILNMEFREIERTADASIVNVTFTSGGSVSSSLFILKGECAVARARGKPYFKTQPSTEHPNVYRMTFPSTVAADMQARLKSGVWAISDCKGMGF